MRERIKRREGTVVSAKMTKTVLVKVDRMVEHELYGKRERRSTKFMAHDERGECKEGDRVQIIESRRLSKNKRWRVSSSHSTTPSENTSLRRSMCSPITCSGDM